MAEFQRVRRARNWTNRGGERDLAQGLTQTTPRPGSSSLAIPARVQAEIARREEAAERLIGWVQLALICAFGVLYLISPRAEGSGGQVFTPYVLVTYLVFTLFRVWLSYRIVLPSWYLVLSIIADVALLCGLIFSFHIQYDQPAAFYLKAPTMIYLFIFISIRALRFEPRFVLLAGLISTLGWFVLVAYALLTDMGQMHITRNFVEYLTSNTILLGAEIDKGIALLGVTFVLTLAQYRARAVLVASIRSHSAAEDLKQFFAPAVANAITGAADLPKAGTSETRDASVLIIDLRAFTKTAAVLPGETVLAVLGLYQQAAVTEIERLGGQIDKFMGDGILATFGAVQPNETHAAAALRAALAVIEAMDRIEPDIRAAGWDGPFQAGVGIAAGRLTVGVVGSQSRLEFTVIGNAVNLAAKLESANKSENTQVLTDVSTFDLAVRQGYGMAPVEIRRGRSIAGIAGLIDLVVMA